MFFRQMLSWNIASGFSSLDLYVMGLIPPEEVSDTFLIAHPQDRTGQEVWGEKVPVRIQASSQPKVRVRDSQKDFTIALYLLYEHNLQPHARQPQAGRGN